MSKLLKASAMSITLLMTGCASIISGSTQTLSFTSIPENSQITIVNRNGVKVHTGQTPATVTLKKGAGYFKPEIYQVTFNKDGYKPQTIIVKGTVSGWYFGNIIFGGLIGILAVDPATGAMYKFNPQDVHAVLEATGVDVEQNQKALAVVMTDKVPDLLMKKAIKVAE